MGTSAPSQISQALNSTSSCGQNVHLGRWGIGWAGNVAGMNFRLGAP